MLTFLFCLSNFFKAWFFTNKLRLTDAHTSNWGPEHTHFKLRSMTHTLQTEVHDTHFKPRSMTHTLQTEVHDTHIKLRSTTDTLQTKVHDTHTSNWSPWHTLQTEVHNTHTSNWGPQHTHFNLRSTTHTSNWGLFIFPGISSSHAQCVRAGLLYSTCCRLSLSLSSLFLSYGISLITYLHDNESLSFG